MHISEGVLPPATLVTGYAASALGIGIGLSKLTDRQLVRTAMLSSAFFIASFIHIPIGPSNLHLVLNGFIGLLTGWNCFIAIGIALLLQALLFQFGGVTTLGVNILIMALPALFSHLIFSPLLARNNVPIFPVGFLAGFSSVFFSALLLSLSLATAGNAFLPAAKLIFFSNVPLMLIDGLVTAIAIQFIRNIKPELLT